MSITNVMPCENAEKNSHTVSKRPNISGYQPIPPLPPILAFPTAKILRAKEP